MVTEYTCLSAYNIDKRVFNGNYNFKMYLFSNHDNKKVQVKCVLVYKEVFNAPMLHFWSRWLAFVQALTCKRL